MAVKNLRVEHMVKPIGLDVKKPEFSWEISSNENSVFQESYRVIVSDKAECKVGNVWDSGEVFSDDTFGVAYGGKKLKPDTKYYFKVICKINGKKVTSEIEYFITGLLGESLNAEWISPSEYEIHDIETCPMVRKTFDIKDLQDVDYATLQIYTFGMHEVYLNGSLADDKMFTPNHSVYKKGLMYDVFCITDKLKEGKNAIGLFIGDGYNARMVDAFGKWTGRKRLIASVNVHYKNGEVVKIPTDSSWKFSYNTPIITNSIYDGEFYDARIETPDWCCPDFDDSDFSNVYVLEPEKVKKLWCSPYPKVRIVERFPARRILDVGNGQYIVDFGQNMAGFAEFSLSGKEGSKIRIKYAEEIKITNRPTQKYVLNIETNRYANAVDTYIFKGEGIETHHPHFTYHGFRYIEVAGLTKKPELSDFTACAVHSDFAGKSYFKTDNRLINRIHENARWSVNSNCLSYMSDCCMRDERTCCSMDIYTYSNVLPYLYDVDEYYKRYLEDRCRHNRRKSPPKKKNWKPYAIFNWSGVNVILPLLLYKQYGDKEVLKSFYTQSRIYLENALEMCPDLNPVEGFGDWCAPNEEGNYLTSFSSTLETELFMMFNTFSAFAETAEILGREDDAEKYGKLALKAKEKYNSMFYNRESQTYSNGSQTPNIYAIKGRFLEEEELKKVSDNLVKSIIDGGNHLDVGIFGSMGFLEVLSDAGFADTAFDCFLNDDYPSLKFQIDNGATTLWEQWCYRGDMASHNHAMFAGIIGGFYTRLAGITPLKPGYREILIKPCTTKYIKNLNCTVHTICGLISVKWKNTDKFTLEVSVPSNCKATVEMPDGTVYNIDNGNYVFTR